MSRGIVPMAELRIRVRCGHGTGNHQFLMAPTPSLEKSAGSERLPPRAVPQVKAVRQAIRMLQLVRRRRRRLRDAL